MPIMDLNTQHRITRNANCKLNLIYIDLILMIFRFYFYVSCGFRLFFSYGYTYKWDENKIDIFIVLFVMVNFLVNCMDVQLLRNIYSIIKQVDVYHMINTLALRNSSENEREKKKKDCKCLL